MEEDGERVFLYVYDLTQGMAKQLSHMLLGTTIEAVWHTGVIVYEKEYYFGGGIQHSPIGKGPHKNPVRVMDLGSTYVPKDIFETYLEEISPRYTAETYSLLKHNCNNFSNEVCQFLVGSGIPEYILELPDNVAKSPMSAVFLPMLEQLDAGVWQDRPNSFQFVKNTENVTADSQETLTDPPPIVQDPLPAVRDPLPALRDPPPAVRDPLGEARKKVQEEIVREFGEIMSTGKVQASEAATTATRKVMHKYCSTHSL